jgi:PAS domain S-box-containing protein
MLQGGGDQAPGSLFALLLLLALAYFAASALLMASLITLKRGEPVHPLKILWGHGWLGVVYAASASISGLLYVSFDRFGPSVLVAAVPIIALFLSTLHFYFRQAEINESAQKERIGATERAAAENAKHLAELRESEDRFHSAFTHAAVGIVLVSTGGRILQANAALARLLGRYEADLVGTDLVAIVHPDDSEMLRAQVGNLLSGTEGTLVRVQHAICAGDIEPSQLTIELTESVLIDKLSAALPHINDLRSIGVQVSIDDFGTGYSSLSALQDLPISEIKVDRSFVRRMGGGSQGDEVVRAIVALGRTLGKRVIAEGIETEAQFAQLAGLGCEGGQGYLLSYPLRAADIPALIPKSPLYVVAA